MSLRKVNQCVLHMPLNEGQGNPHDSSGLGHNGTNHGADWLPGDFGYVMDFNGTSDWVDLAQTAGGVFEQMTLMAWVRWTNVDGAWETPLHRGVGTSVGGSIFFIALYGGQHKIVCTIGAGAGIGFDPGDTGLVVQPDRWYHIVNSWDGATERVYVDKIKKCEFAFSNYTPDAGAKTRLGASGDAGGYLTQGAISDVRIYNRAWTEAEIIAYYDGMKGRFGL